VRYGPEMATDPAPVVDPASWFQPADPGFIAKPYPALAQIRSTTPIFWNEASSQWVLTRFADVHEALRDRRLGRTYEHLYSHAAVGRPEPDPRWSRFREHERWSLLSLEPPDHTRIRQLISKVFTVRSVTQLRPFLEATATATLQAALLKDGGTFDLIKDYAQPYSVAVICEMLGVPVTDSQRLLDWSHAIVRMYELNASDEQKAAADEAAGAFMEYTRALISKKRSRPDDALVSALVNVEEDGKRLTDDEIICTTIVLLNAGHEATVNTLGNGMRAFMLHPSEWDRLVSGEVQPKTAVEEMLRWDSPLQLFERWVLEDGVTIAGQTFRVGEEIAMLFGSANRDPDRFVDPDRFDAGRRDMTHVGFGGGIHFCVGAPLARAEIEVSIDVLRSHAPRLTLAAEPSYTDAFVIRGLTALMLTAR
jgi:cytochrome P450